MGACCSAPTEAQLLDTNNDGTISREELSKFIEKNAKLYAMLGVNLNLPEDQCREIATEVAYQLAKRDKLESSLKDYTPEERHREPTVKELQSFLDFVKEPQGEQEFFQRTVFEAFDADKNGYIDSDELDKFLDVFYEAGSIFAGDLRLPKKSILKKRVMKDLDSNGDGRLEFHEIRSLISGGVGALNLGDEMEPKKKKKKKKKKANSEESNEKSTESNGGETSEQPKKKKKKKKKKVPKDEQPKEEKPEE